MTDAGSRNGPPAFDQPFEAADTKQRVYDAVFMLATREQPLRLLNRQIALRSRHGHISPSMLT